MAKLNFSIALGLAAQNFKQGLSQAQAQLKGFASSVKSAFGMVAGAFAAGQIKQFSQECLNAYKDQQIAETKLQTIMRQRMQATDDEVKSILKLTSAQQQLGVIGDEVQIAGAQQVATFVNEKQSLETLIPAMNNLLAQQKGLNASQGDAVSIGNLMGKVMQGQTSALKRVGITFTEAEEKVLKYGNEQERAAMLAKVITNNVGDMNSELAKTDLGKIQQMNNTLGDLKEKIGAAIAPIVAELAPKIASTAESAANSITSAIAFIKDNFSALVIHITSIFAGIKFTAWGRQIIAVFKGVGASIQTQATVTAVKLSSLENKMLNEKVSIERMKLKASKDGLTEESAYYEKIKKKEKALEDMTNNHHKVAVEARLARLRAYKFENASIFGKISILAGNAFRGVGTAMKAAFSTVWPMLLVTAIMEVVMWIGKMVSKANEMKQLQNDIKKNAADTSFAHQAQELEILKRRLEEAHSKHKDEKKIMDACNKALGTTETKYENLNKLLATRIARLKRAAEIEGAKDKLRELGRQKAELLLEKQQRVDEAKQLASNVAKPGIQTSSGAMMPFQVQGSIGISGQIKSVKDRIDSISKDLKNIEEQERIIGEMIPDEDLGNGSGDGSGDGDGSNSSGGGSSSSSNEKKLTDEEQAAEKIIAAEKAYAQTLNAINESEKNGHLTQLEAQKQKLQALNTKYDAYAEAFGITQQKEYSDAMAAMVPEIKKMTSIIEDAEKEATQRDAYNKAVGKLNKVGGSRDTTYDYKLTESERATADLEHEIDVVRQKLAILQDEALQGIDSVQKQITELMAQDMDLETKLNLQAINEDVAKLKEELKNSITDGVIEGWQSLTGTISSVNDMLDKFADPDTSGWEKFVSVIDTAIGVFQTVMGVIELINSIKKASTALTLAEAAAEKVKAAATLKAAAAAIFAAHAYIPMAGVGIASGQVGTMMGVMAGLNAVSLSTGGIVKGSSLAGDFVPALLNSQEAVLNPTQQSRFMKIANGGGVGNSNIADMLREVRFIISGDNLEGTFNNHMSRKGLIR